MSATGTNIENQDENVDFQSENIEEVGQYDYVHGLKKSVFYQPENQKHWRKYGFLEYENQYWFGRISQKDDVRTLTFTSLSNFIIRPLLLIDSLSDPKRIYEIENVRGQKKVKAFGPREFTSLESFSPVVESLGNFWLQCNKGQFNKIKIKLYELCLSAIEIKTLGYHADGFYAFGNGIQNSQWVALDQDGYGIVEHNKQRYFLPALSKIYSADEDEFQTHKLFIRQEPENPIPFEDYARRFCEVYPLNGNGRIALLYYITCLFRDVVYGHFRFFPHLFLFGPPQSGKSSIAWSIMYLFGEPRKPFMLNTGTAVAFYKQFAEFQNAVVWFDEYQNSIDYQRVQSLKTAYDGAGHTKSENTKDNRNRSIPVKSGCIVSGQELPTADVALFTRCILLQFTKTDYTQEEKDLYSRFNEDVERLGISYLTAQLSQFRKEFKASFIKHFDHEFSLLKQHFAKCGVDDRMAKNISILLSTYRCLTEHVTFPFSLSEIRQTAYNIVADQGSLIVSNKETSTFWKQVMFLARIGKIECGKDYTLQFQSEVKPRGRDAISVVDEHHPHGQYILYIHLSNLHTAYQASAKAAGEKVMDVGSLRNYLTQSKNFISSLRTHRYAKSITTALAFFYERIAEDVDGFHLPNDEQDQIPDDDFEHGL